MGTGLARGKVPLWDKQGVGQGSEPPGCFPSGGVSGGVGVCGRGEGCSGPCSPAGAWPLPLGCRGGVACVGGCGGGWLGAWIGDRLLE